MCVCFRLLIQAGYDVNIKDYDGWTPLHAAAHWGKDEACRVLVENLCDMDVVNKVVINLYYCSVISDASEYGQCDAALRSEGMINVLN